MRFLTFAVVLVGWVFSLCLHEFAHALVAYLGGDTSVREKGYLTFNPLRYTHPLYSLLMPLLFLLIGGIGLPGGAVYIETWRLRSRRWMSAVSLAGPAANLLLALLLGLLFRLVPAAPGGVWPALAFLGFLQVSALVLNLIPLPPFDGFGALEPHLRGDVRLRLAETRGVLVWVVFLLLWYVPFIGRLFWGLVAFLAHGLGISLPLAMLGWSQFQFWR